MAAILQPLAQPSYQLDIQFTGPRRPAVVGLGPVGETHGVVVSFIDDGESPIELREMDSSQIPGALLGLLGPVTPGFGPTVNLPADLLYEACEAVGGDAELWEVADYLADHGIPRRDTIAMARMNTDINSADNSASPPGTRDANADAPG